MAQIVLEPPGNRTSLGLVLPLQLLDVLIIRKLNLLLLAILNLLDAGQEPVLGLDRLRLEYLQKSIPDYAAHSVLYFCQLRRISLPVSGDLAIQDLNVIL